MESFGICRSRDDYAFSEGFTRKLRPSRFLGVESVFSSSQEPWSWVASVNNPLFPAWDGEKPEWWGVYSRTDMDPKADELVGLFWFGFWEMYICVSFPLLSPEIKYLDPISFVLLHPKIDSWALEVLPSSSSLHQQSEQTADRKISRHDWKLTQPKQEPLWWFERLERSVQTRTEWS